MFFAVDQLLNRTRSYVGIAMCAKYHLLSEGESTDSIFFETNEIYIYKLEIINLELSILYETVSDTRLWIVLTNLKTSVRGEPRSLKRKHP